MLYFFVGSPVLTGTTTLTIMVLNSNDKDPYFDPATQRAEVRLDQIEQSLELLSVSVLTDFVVTLAQRCICSLFPIKCHMHD